MAVFGTLFGISLFSVSRIPSNEAWMSLGRFNEVCMVLREEREGSLAKAAHREQWLSSVGRKDG